MATIAGAALALSSPSFDNQSYIPSRFSCDGENINPAINVSGLPAGTQTLALILDDPDAPGGTFDHWLVWNIPPADLINENAVPGTEGMNGWGEIGYRGPCPPSGTHRYYFRLFALDAELNIPSGAGRFRLEQAMKGHVLATAELVGLYKKVR